MKTETLRPGLVFCAFIVIGLALSLIALPSGTLTAGEGESRFGYDSIGSENLILYGRITGSVFTCPTLCKAQSIVVYVTSSDQHTMRCGIYWHDNSGLVAETEQRVNCAPPFMEPPEWVTFNFPTPLTLEAGVEYVLVAHADSEIYMYYDPGDTNQGHYQIPWGQDNLPSTASFTHEDRKYSIYCVYTAKPTKPSLYLPANGSTDNDSTPYFEWEDVELAGNYRLLVDDDPNFLSPEEDRIVLDNNYTIAPEDSLPDGSYSWKVVAISSEGENESDVWTFVVDTVAPPAPTLVSPSNNAVEYSLSVTLTWTSVSDPSGVTYHIQIDDEASFDTVVHENSAVTGNSYNYTFSTYGTYYWRVRAGDGAVNWSPWADSFKLIIKNVSVSISPGENGAALGGDATFTVTVTNTGDVTDDFDLTASPENPDWTSSVSPSTLEISAGGSENATLTVSVPSEASVGDNTIVTVIATSQSYPSISDNDNCIVHAVQAVNVEVSISPSENHGSPGEDIAFTVTVTNIGYLEDNYTLENTDDAGWNLSLSEDRFESVGTYESRQTTLTVSIPSNAEVGDNTTITVTATSQENENVSDDYTAVAKVIAGVSISVTPPEDGGPPNGTVTFTVTVTNTGDVLDNYDLSASPENPNWTSSVSPSTLEISAGGSDTATLNVFIPPTAENLDSTTVTVTVTPQADPTVSDDDNCTVVAEILPGVDVSIEAPSTPPSPDDNAYFTVRVTNIGNVPDNYNLTVEIENTDWAVSLDSSTLSVAGGSYGTTELTVSIPQTAENNDNTVVTVTATSPTYGVNDNDSILVIARILPEVSVEITPSERSHGPGENVTFTVTVTNAGNVPDNYDLSASPENADWTSSISPSTLEIPGGWSENATLTVTVPPTAEKGDNTVITVTVTSQGYPDVESSDTCGAYASVILARLYLYTAYIFGTSSVAVQGCSDDWNEDNIVEYYPWPGPPPTTSIIDQKTLSSSNKWYSWDVSSFVDDEYYKDGVVSLRMRIPTQAGMQMTYFYSKENLVFKPYLEVVYPFNINSPLLYPDADTYLTSRNDENGATIHLIVKSHTENANAYLKFTIPRYEGGSVDITPEENYALPGKDMDFAVTVTNIWDAEDNYTLEVVANTDWNLSLSENRFENVPPGGSGQATLTVSVPPAVSFGDNTTLTIICTPQKYSGFVNDVSCVAYAGFADVEVSITPDNDNALPGRTVTFTVTVTNTGNVEDTYTLENTDDAGWTLALSDNSVGPLSPGSSDNNVTLTVTIPDDTGLYCTWDNVIVTATSQENLEVSNNDNCSVHAVPPEVSVEITPDSENALPGRTVTFTVTVTNPSPSEESYSLEKVDDLGWALSLQDLITVPAGQSQTATLSVTIPDDTGLYYTWDNIMVTATSQTDPTIKGNDNCSLQAVPPEVQVSIDPEYLDNLPGRTSSFTVTVTNPSPSEENYTLEKVDDLGWALSLQDLITVPAGQSQTATLSVTIPDDTGLYYTWDNIMVTATSQTDPTVENSDNCSLQVVPPEVSVEITPDSKNALPGSTATFIVTVTNPSPSEENYSLVAEDNENWVHRSLEPSDDSYVAMGQSANTNYGDSPTLVAAHYTYIYMKWQLPPLPGKFISAKILMYGRLDPAYGGTRSVNVLGVENDNWRENEITCNFRPGTSGPLTNATSVTNTWGWRSWDVTSWVDNQLKVDNIVSVAFEKPSGTGTIWFDSKEGAYKPRLMILYEGLSHPVSLGSITVPAGGSRTTALCVTTADNTELYCTQDNVKVTAISQTDPRFENSDNCWVHVVPPEVSVEITPDSENALPGRTVTFTVTVTNPSPSEESYSLEKVDDLGWALSLQNLITVPAGQSQAATLSVTIPDDTGLYYTWDNIMVTATSQTDPTIKDNDNCSLQAVPPEVQVSIDPEYLDNLPGRTSSFTVTVTNPSPSEENYSLEKVDDLGWTLSLQDLITVPAGKSQAATLSVTIPDDTGLYYTWDNIMVTATSQTDPTIKDNDNCSLQVVPPEVQVSIDPDENENVLGITLQYTVTVTNPSPSEENYTLEKVDDLGWPLALDNNSFTIPAGGNQTTTLYVTIPEDAENCTRDNIMVTATSQTDPTIKGNDNCLAHAILYRGVKVSISPDENGNRPSKNVTFTVTVTNEGVRDNYALEVSDNAGWTLELADNLLMIPPLENRTTTLTAQIPWPLVGNSDNITVTATSLTDSAVSDNDSCIARVAREDWVVWVWISPSENSGLPGEDVTFTVTVINVGNNVDNYTLTKSVFPPDPSWPTALGTDSFNNVGTDENQTTTLTVSIPSGAVPGTSNPVYVEAKGDGWELLRKDTTWCTVNVELMDVDVSISPQENIGAPGDTVTFTVSVTNTGNVTGSYTLENIDDEGWTKSLSQDSVGPLAPGASAEVTLEVSIPSDAGAGTEDTITVTATSQEDDEISDNDSCIAAIKAPGVSVSISPEGNSGAPGDTVTFTVSVTNTGNVEDTYDLSAGDTADWTLNLPSSTGSLAPGAHENVTLQVTILSTAGHGDSTTVTVTAASQENQAVSASDTCTASAVIIVNRGVEVSISPSENSGTRGENVGFTVTIKNTGDVTDAYTLTASDNVGWALSLSPSSISLAADALGTVTLTVTIPAGAADGTRDSITVTATGTGVSDNASCIAHAIAEVIRGVEVSISPSEDDGAPGGTVTFTVTVTNTGNVADDYNLSKTDDAGWSLTLPSTVTGVAPDQSKQVTLTVGIPATAENCTRDNITVTATSSENTAVVDSATCVAHCLVEEVTPAGVQVTISPENQTGSPGETLTFTVTIKNTGETEDTYDLEVSDDAGWGAWLDANVLTILPGDNTIAILSITVDEDASEGDSTQITVTARSRADPAVSDSDTCMANVEEEQAPPPGDSVPLVAGAAAIGGGATIVVLAVLFKKGIISLPSIRSRFLRLYSPAHRS